MKHLFFTLLTLCFYAVAAAQIFREDPGRRVAKEIQYWKYVAQNDKVSYLTLWHDNFIGYPDSDSLTPKSKIADWIKDLHNKKDMHYEYNLVKNVVNVFGDVAITFYDEDDIWKNNKNEITSRETYKITHTWKKNGDTWL